MNYIKTADTKREHTLLKKLPCVLYILKKNKNGYFILFDESCHNTFLFLQQFSKSLNESTLFGTFFERVKASSLSRYCGYFQLTYRMRAVIAKQNILP